MKYYKVSTGRREFGPLLLCTAVVALVNTLFGGNKIMSYATLLFELLLLVYMFIKKRYIDYLGLYIIFCGLSMEYDKLVGSTTFYGFKNTRVLGINLGILALLPLFLVSVKYIFEIKGKRFSRFYKLFMFIQASALIIGLLMILFNDNGVQAIPNVLRLFADNLYTMCFQQFLIIVIFVMLVNRCDDFEDLENYFLCLLIGVVLSLGFSRLFGVRGYYGGVQTLIASNNARWLPMMLLFPLYSKYREKKYIWIIGLIGAVLVLSYNATGKMIILYALIAFIYIYLSVKNKQYKKTVGIILLSPVIVVGVYWGIRSLSSSSPLFSSKLNQALSLLDYLSGRITTDDVSNSPRLRLYETGNIILEYVNKPWLFLLGKGFLGTVKNHTGMTYHYGAYSNVQWDSGLFFRMHESINKLMLSNGIVGLYFLIVTFKNGLKDIAKTPWGLIGLYWLLICYGHSITMTAFGFSCLVYSIVQADKIDDTYEESNMKRHPLIETNND